MNDLHIGHAIERPRTYQVLANPYCFLLPGRLVHDACHERICLLETALKRERVVASDAVVAGCEHDSGGAFEDEEIVEEVRVLEEQAVDWMGAEVDGAAAGIRSSLLRQQRIVLPCATEWRILS
jgi:hypothetical protein